MGADRTASPRPGPVYDDAMKILAAEDLDAVLSLVGRHGDGARELNVELPGSAKRADLLARTPVGIVHVEFVKDRSPGLDLRMVEYWVRIRRRYRHVPVEQYVLVIGDDATVPDRCIERGRDVLRWTVVRLGDLDPQPLLLRPVTAAVAALARGTTLERAGVLTAAAQVIGATDPDRGRTLLDAATILASIVLPATIIDSALKEATVPILLRETPLGREIYEEGLRAGEQRGLREGEQRGLREGEQRGLREGERRGLREGEQRAVLRLTRAMLRQRFGDDPRVDAIAEQLAQLPDEERLTAMSSAESLDALQR